MEGLGVQSIEEFWGVELSSKKKKFEWMKEDEEDDLDELDLDRTLELRQGCLGSNAKEGERNVVQITAENDEGEKVKHSILSLRVGGTEQCALFLTLHPPVTFELVAGSGPVHVVGSSVESINGFDSDSSSDESEVEVSSPEVKALLASASKKRPANSPVSKPAKQMKLDRSSGESAGDTSMDTSGSLGLSKLSKRKVQEEDPEDFDSEDDEEFDDDDSEEEDSEEEEDESEESEEEEVKPPSKKPQTNGKSKQKGQLSDIKSKMFKTPQPTKTGSKTTKGSMSAPTTPKQQADKKGAMKGSLGLDEAKKRLLKQLPSIPKKLEKFNNFVGNSLKIKDDSAKKQLWEFVQKNRPEK